VFEIDERTFEVAVVERSRTLPVVVVFTSDAAPLCRLAEAAVEEEIGRRGAAVELVRLDVDRARGLAERFRVSMLPTLVAFRGGERVADLAGARPREAAARFLDAVFAPSGAQRLVEELRAEREWLDVVAALDELDYGAAFEALLGRAARGGLVERERVRRLMLSLFDQLGADHPLSARYRRRLAAALY
jgi:thioredoxin-like negative regulator of GroEL